MKITIEGKLIKTWDELEIGEHGYIRHFDAAPGDIEPGLVVWPSSVRFQRDRSQSCYRITKTADGANLEFVPFVDTEEELVVCDESMGPFQLALTWYQEKGWRINDDSIRIVSAGDGEWRFFATMYRDRDGDA